MAAAGNSAAAARPINIRSIVFIGPSTFCDRVGDRRQKEREARNLPRRLPSRYALDHWSRVRQVSPSVVICQTALGLTMPGLLMRKRSEPAYAAGSDRPA